MQLTEDEGRVLGALADAGGQCPPGELSVRYDFSEPYLFEGGRIDFRVRASALLHVDNGVRGLLSKGLIEEDLEGHGVKVLRMTQKGRKLAG